MHQQDRAAGHQKKVLIVDDNESVLMALEYSLRQEGYAVFMAQNGKSAYETALAEKPDIIVSDITMPEMNGMEFCKMLRSHPAFSDLPFIFLTARGEADERVKGLRCGADDYIVKPFDIEELIIRINILYQKINKKNSSGTLSGNLRDMSLADTLQMFEMTKKEGRIIIHSGSTGVIAFRDGMIMDASMGDANWEDAMVAMLTLREGSFSYEPGEITGGSIERPVGFVLLEIMRMIDERTAVENYVPDHDRLLARAKPAEENTHEVRAIAEALAGGPLSLKELLVATGLSRIRAELAAGRLLRDGCLSFEEARRPVEPEAKKQNRPVKILFTFTQEPPASAFLTDTAKAFQSAAPRGIKAGMADFMKVSARDSSIHIFSLRGEKKFSFLWEPMIPKSDAIVFLMNSPGDREHAEFLKASLKSSRDLPFHIITTDSRLIREDTAFMENTDDIRDFFVGLI